MIFDLSHRTVLFCKRIFLSFTIIVRRAKVPRLECPRHNLTYGDPFPWSSGAHANVVENVIRACGEYQDGSVMYVVTNRKIICTQKDCL
jgi:hypothetical protein